MIVGDLIKLFRVSLMKKQLLNTLNTMNYNLLVLSKNIHIEERDCQSI